MKEVYNFSAGPAVIAREVLERAREGMFSIGGSGLSVMEVSHRSKYFEPILAAAEQGIRGLMGLPDNYKVLFLQGSATGQMAAVPLNLTAPGSTAVTRPIASFREHISATSAARNARSGSGMYPQNSVRSATPSFAARSRHCSK